MLKVARSAPSSAKAMAREKAEGLGLVYAEEPGRRFWIKVGEKLFARIEGGALVTRTRKGGLAVDSEAEVEDLYRDFGCGRAELDRLICEPFFCPDLGGREDDIDQWWLRRYLSA